MRVSRLHLFVLSVSLFAFSDVSNAALIVAWDVAGVDVADGTGISSGSAPYDFDATTEFSANVNGTLSLGAGVSPSTTANKYGFKVPSGDEQTTLAGAVANDQYFQFDITIDSGFELDLSSIEMFGESTGTGSDDVAILTSLDGFAASIASVTGVAGVTGGFDTDSSGFGAPIDLTAATYQNLAGTVSFRVYGYNTSSGSGSTRLRSLGGDDLAIFGTLTAIPEPSSFLLAGMVLSLFIGWENLSAAFHDRLRSLVGHGTCGKS